MCFFFSFLPATIWFVLGYFVLFSSSKSDGALRKCGRVLAIWVFIVAACFPVIGAYVTYSGLCPVEAMLQAVRPR